MAATSTKTPVIEIRNLHYAYGESVVLDNVSFTITSGEYIGIIGPNGGGKTTLLKLMVGLSQPTSGEVLLNGKSVNHAHSRRFIGYVPQRIAETARHFPATVQEIIESGRTPRLGLFQRPSKTDRHAIENAMEVAGVAKYKKRLIADLSGGERQRVFIARALAGDPTALILDEPTVGIDPHAQEKFYSLIDKLNHDLGITIVFVSHDVDVIAGTASRCLCLNRELVCHGSPEEIMKQDTLEKLYGKKLSFIHHGHTH